MNIKRADFFDDAPLIGTVVEAIHDNEWLMMTPSCGCLFKRDGRLAMKCVQCDLAAMERQLTEPVT